MNATITGSDPLSKRIMLDLDAGLKVSQVPEHYPVSLDQTKRLSRFNKMLSLAKDHLDEDLYNRLQQLGIKSLPLSHLFRQDDWGGVVEILSVVTDETTRDELQLLINALNEKRERILEFKEKADLSLSQLEKAEQSLQIKEKELLMLQKEMNEQLRIFYQYPDPFHSFLGEYLGLYEGKLVLAKRLNVNWQRSLRKQGIIEYDEFQYIYFLKDFNSFIESLKSRHDRGLEYRWDPDKDIKRITKSTPWADVPHDGKYKIPTAFSDPFIDSMNKVKQELKEIKDKKVAIEDKLIKIKHETVQSYMEMAEASDYLSAADLKRHKELQDKALKWLFNRGFIAVAEFTLPNGKRADIFAYNESQIVVFEIKVSKSDLMTDQKWTEYLPYCHDLFFLTPVDLKDAVVAKIKSVNCGQFIETANSIRLVKPDERNVKQVNGDGELKFSAAQLLSKKFIYGY
jgi:DNA repair protein MmcB-like